MFIFFVRNKEALPCVRRCSWWVPAVRGKRFFANTVARPVGTAVRWRNNYFARNKEALPCCGRGPSCQPLHVQSMSDGSRSLTTLTTPRREHQAGGRRRGLGRGTHGAGCPYCYPRSQQYNTCLVAPTVTGKGHRKIEPKAKHFSHCKKDQTSRPNQTDNSKRLVKITNHT